jgi:transcriptional antiterminator NusG
VTDKNGNIDSSEQQPEAAVAPEAKSLPVGDDVDSSGDPIAKRRRSTRSDAGVPIEELFSADEIVTDDEDDEDDGDGEASPIEELVEAAVEPAKDLAMDWYILKVQVNRENSICEALKRNIKRSGMELFFGDILVPTEDVKEFNKNGKSRVIKRKLYPGYIVVRMAINDETWFLVRDTPGIGDFTGAAGKPAPLGADEIQKILAAARPEETEDGGDETIKTAIKSKIGERVRVKDGYFQNYEGEVSNIDERNGRVTVMINIFGRANPVELDHWQIESI